MSRSTWKGMLTISMVSVPVELHTAARDEKDRVSFKMLHPCVPPQPAKGKGKAAPGKYSPIKQERACQNEECPSKGKTLEWDSLVKGYEFASGQYVIMDPADFVAATVEGSKVLDIGEFVKVEEVPLRYLEKPYFLAPQKGAERAYALVREALRRTGTVGVCNAKTRENSSHLACVGVEADALVLYNLRYADTVVDPASFQWPGRDVGKKELELAEKLIEGMREAFQPEKYRDEYADNVREIIDAKLKGKQVEVKKPLEPAATSAIDLMARLQESVAAPKKRKLRKTA